MLDDKKTITLKYGMSNTKIWNFKKQFRVSKSYRKYVNVLGLQSECFCLIPCMQTYNISHGTFFESTTTPFVQLVSLPYE